VIVAQLLARLPQGAWIENTARLVVALSHGPTCSIDQVDKAVVFGLQRAQRLPVQANLQFPTRTWTASRQVVAGQAHGIAQADVAGVGRLAGDGRAEHPPQSALRLGSDLDVDPRHLLDQVHRPAGAQGQIKHLAKCRVIGPDEREQAEQVSPLASTYCRYTSA